MRSRRAPTSIEKFVVIGVGLIGASCALAVRRACAVGEIVGWANAIRCDTPLNCGPEKAMHSASWTIAANEAMKSGQIVKVA